MPLLEMSVIVMKDAATVLIGKPAEGPDAGKWVVPGGFIAEGETAAKAAERVVLENGVQIDTEKMLFLSISEVLEPVHRVSVFAYAQYQSGEPTPGLPDLQWADIRGLGTYQKEGMSDLTVDGFVKFSRVLAAQAVRSGVV